MASALSFAPSAAARNEETSFETIEAVAMRDPRRLAVADGAQRYTYAQLWDTAIRFTRALHARGVRRGHRVALSESGLLPHLAAVLACENLGACTASFLEQGDPDAEALFALVDWVFTPQSPMLPAGVRHIALDAAFVADVEAMDPRDPSPYPRVALELHEPMRMTRTSGSTGKAKWMEFDRHTQEVWIVTAQLSRDYLKDGVVLLGAPLVVNAVLTLALGMLRRGAVVAAVRGGELQGLELTHYYGLPVHLERFLGELPPGFVPRRPVAVGTVGGFVSGQLRAQVESRLRGELHNLYGANEVGGICPYFDARGVGELMPGTEVRILDDDGAELPRGQVGAVAARSPWMVRGYMGNAAATAESFRDGWFLPGDRGMLVGERRLQLLGRDDDVLVLNGVKLPAFELENRLRAVPAVEDAAVVNLHNRPGSTVFGLALVTKPDADQGAVRARLPAALDLGTSAVAQAAFVQALPRTANGKVDRRALQKLFA